MSEPYHKKETAKMSEFKPLFGNMPGKALIKGKLITGDSMSLKTINEMSELLRVSPKTFRNMVDAYNLPYTKVGARGKRFDERKVMQKLEAVGFKEEAPTVKPKRKPTLDFWTEKGKKFAEEFGLDI